MTEPERFKPVRTNRQITEEAADAFATTAARLREKGIAADFTSRILPTHESDTRHRSGRAFPRMGAGVQMHRCRRCGEVENGRVSSIQTSRDQPLR